MASYFTSAGLDLTFALRTLRDLSFAAADAKSVLSEKARLCFGTASPPLLAISRRFSNDMAAKPLGFFMAELQESKKEPPKLSGS